jgi:hypothetical protein
VRPLMIVMVSPSFNDDLRVLSVQEPLPTEAFIPKNKAQVINLLSLRCRLVLWLS